MGKRIDLKDLQQYIDDSGDVTLSLANIDGSSGKCTTVAYDELIAKYTKSSPTVLMKGWPGYVP